MIERSAPLVSVITIFLDEQRFLEEAIASVRAQTYARWELLLVDDGSRDASPALAREHARRDPDRVRYVQHADGANRGMSASRNLGLRHARGELVAFLDADDVFLPEKLERQVAILLGAPTAALVYGATWRWHGWTGRPEDEAKDHRTDVGGAADRLVAPPRLATAWLGRRGVSPATCSSIVRRSAAMRVGGFEESFPAMFEDQAFFYKLALASPAFVDSGAWDRYRQHPDSACQRALRDGSWRQGRPSPSHRAFLEWLSGYVREQAIGDRQLRRTLRRRLLPYRHPRLHRVAAAAHGARRRWRRAEHERS